MTDHGQIVRNYVFGWFTVDLISVFPFDLVGMLSEDDQTSNMKIFRLVRLFRLTFGQRRPALCQNDGLAAFVDPLDPRLLLPADHPGRWRLSVGHSACRRHMQASAMGGRSRRAAGPRSPDLA